MIIIGTHNCRAITEIDPFKFYCISMRSKATVPTRAPIIPKHLSSRVVHSKVVWELLAMRGRLDWRGLTAHPQALGSGSDVSSHLRTLLGVKK